MALATNLGLGVFCRFRYSAASRQHSASSPLDVPGVCGAIFDDDLYNVYFYLNDGLVHGLRFGAILAAVAVPILPWSYIARRASCSVPTRGACLLRPFQWVGQRYRSITCAMRSFSWPGQLLLLAELYMVIAAVAYGIDSARLSMEPIVCFPPTDGPVCYDWRFVTVYESDGPSMHRVCDQCVGRAASRGVPGHRHAARATASAPLDEPQLSHQGSGGCHG